MIVTIDDYRGTANPEDGPCHETKLKDDGSEFTVANAGILKLKLLALNSQLMRTPLDKHSILNFDDMLGNVSSRTYINGSEAVYFAAHILSWPSQIPEIFIKAYREVLQGRPFTNMYIWNQSTSVSNTTFSAVRPVLRELDMICGTKLDDYFLRAESQVKPFPFMRLPTELRLEIFDYLIPTRTPLRVFKNDTHSLKKREPVRLDIMRVSKALHEETVNHSLNNSSLYIEAYPDLRQSICVQAYFTKATIVNYVARILRMSYEVRSKITRLEIRVIPEDAASPIDSYHPAQLETLLLRRACAGLPNLQSVLISFEKMPERLCLLNGRARWPNKASFFKGQRFSLAWIHAQLPEKGPRIVWDLTHFRHPVEEPALLKKEMLFQPMMRELLETYGTLELAQSANLTRADLQLWSEIKDVIHKAIAQL